MFTYIPLVCKVDSKRNEVGALAKPRFGLFAPFLCSRAFLWARAVPCEAQTRLPTLGVRQGSTGRYVYPVFVRLIASISGGLTQHQLLQSILSANQCAEMPTSPSRSGHGTLYVLKQKVSGFAITAAQPIAFRNSQSGDHAPLLDSFYGEPTIEKRQSDGETTWSYSINSTTASFTGDAGTFVRNWLFEPTQDDRRWVPMRFTLDGIGDDAALPTLFTLARVAGQKFCERFEGLRFSHGVLEIGASTTDSGDLAVLASRSSRSDSPSYYGSHGSG